MNNSMQEAFDLTYIFCIPTCEKITENPPYALKKTKHSIIIKGGKGLNTNDEKIQWHPAFDAALQIEFGDEAKYLEFDPEHLISKKPMQIDVLVKNEKHVKLRKNIGRIFRQYNIIEYKSPEDDLDIDDFYKTYAYACLYKSDTETVDMIPADELTITFVCYHYPRNMIRKLEQDRKISVEQEDSGIGPTSSGMPSRYSLSIVPKLSKEHNYWLNNLRNDLKAGSEIKNFIESYSKNKNSKLYQALADAVMRANWEKLKEGSNMCEALKELFADDFKESELKGRNAGRIEGRNEGRIEGRIELIIKIYQKGYSAEDTADMLEEPVSRIQQIYDVIKRKALRIVTQRPYTNSCVKKKSSWQAVLPQS